MSGTPPLLVHRGRRTLRRCPGQTPAGGLKTCQNPRKKCKEKINLLPGAKDTRRLTGPTNRALHHPPPFHSAPRGGVRSPPHGRRGSGPGAGVLRLLAVMEDRQAVSAAATARETGGVALSGRRVPDWRKADETTHRPSPLSTADEGLSKTLY